MRVLAKKIYARIPARFRGGFSPMFRLLALARQIRPEFWIVEGSERSSGLPLSILCSSDSRGKSYLSKVSFGSSFRERSLGRIWLWNLPRVSRMKARDCSLALIEIPDALRRFLRLKGCAYAPLWLHGTVDLPYRPEVMRSPALKSDLRRIHKNGLTYEVTGDPRKIDEFYDRMYLPYITSVHEDRAVLRTRQAFAKEAPRCELVVVKRGEEEIAGSLLIKENPCPRIWVIGIRDGNRDFLQAGAAVAAFHCAAVHAQSQGHRMVHFGLTRPFFRDGVFHFKKKWSQKLIDTGYPCFAIKLLRGTEAAHAWLVENPFVFRTGGSLEGAFFVESDRPLLPEVLFRLDKAHGVPGLSMLNIFRLPPADPSKPPRQDDVPPELSGRIAVRPAEELLGR